MSERLSAEEELRLLARARAGDREAEARLVREHLAPAYRLVNRYRRGRRIPKEDLEQEAALALVTALRRFDPGRGVRLVTYAMWWVRVRLQRTRYRWQYFSQEPNTHDRWLDTFPQVEPPPPGPGVDLALLTQLSPKRRAVVERLLGLNGHRQHRRSELFAALGIRPAAANKLYTRALEQLRRLSCRDGDPRRAA
jgi:DNA-directed RNA polymerase sigma subunit (sigma70/sigma32)